MPPDGSRAIARAERIWLRALERTDLDAYWEFINDVEVALWAGYGAPKSRDQVTRWYEDVVLEQTKHGALYFAISPIESDEFLGTVWIWNLDSRVGDAELSVYIGDPERWGSGIGVEAVNAALDMAFGFNALRRIWLYTDSSNPRSERAFTKAGFRREGVLRENVLRRGEREDSILMAILRSDWEALERPRSWEIEGR